MFVVDKVSKNLENFLCIFNSLTDFRLILLSCVTPSSVAPSSEKPSTSVLRLFMLDRSGCQVLWFTSVYISLRQFTLVGRDVELDNFLNIGPDRPPLKIKKDQIFFFQI